MYAYLIIGGPLDGKFASTEDFMEHWEEHLAGKYTAHKNDYAPFKSAAGNYGWFDSGTCSMVWIHRDLMDLGRKTIKQRDADEV
jgi:hypothetical protein